MTSVKKNDFAEGFITSGTGYLVTVKNLANKQAVEAFGKLENQEVSLIWDKTNTRFAVQEGQGQFYEITLKSFEDVLPTYIKKQYVLKDQVMAMFDNAGITPKWTVYDPENKIYTKVE